MESSTPAFTPAALMLNTSESRLAFTMSTTLMSANHSTSHVPPHVEVVIPRDWGYMSLENVRRMNVGEAINLNQYTVILYGCVMPIFAILTLCTNCFVCTILTQQGMRNATGSLLVAMALSEMSMAIWPVPPFLYFFTLGNYVEWVPHPWCYASLWMLEFLPTIFHGTSVWLTVALAGQRYLSVCKPLETQRWCVSHAPGAIQCAIVIFLLVLGTQLSRIFESDFSARDLPSRVAIGKTVTGCTSEFAPFVSAFTDIYFKAYYCIKTLALHVIPCLLVIYLALRIVITKLKNKYPKDKMLTFTYRSRLKRYLVEVVEGKYTTGLVLGFLMLFLIVEVPLASFYAIELFQNKMVFEFDIVGSDTLTSMILFANLSTVISSPMKFLIFIIFCKKFRVKMKLLLMDMKEKCSCRKDEDEDELEG